MSFWPAHPTSSPCLSDVGGLESWAVSDPLPIVILGPTASGKSQLAASLAERLGASCGAMGQVISADSMQVYRHLDAGTAKPPPALRKRVRHHLIDVVDPADRFTVADWLGRADAAVERLQHLGIVPIVAGGTNLYIKAMLEGLWKGPAVNPRLRLQLAKEPAQALHGQLVKIDPEAAQRIHPNDHRRIVRALEVYQETGRPISQWQTQWDPSPNPSLKVQPVGHRGGSAYRHRPILIGLSWPVEAINRRINRRVKAMFYPEKVSPSLADEVIPLGESLPEEAARLMDGGLLGRQARQAIGYKQVIDHLAGRCSLQDAFEKTKIQTRRFAKMQRTWLRRFRSVHWIEPDGMDEPSLVENALHFISN